MKFKELLAKYKELGKRIAEAKPEEMDALLAEKRSLEAQMEIAKATEDAEAEEQAAQARSAQEAQNAETRTAQEAQNDPAVRTDSRVPDVAIRSLTAGLQAEVDRRNAMDDDIFGSMEYRLAFRDYSVNGTPIPAKFKRDGEGATATGDAFSLVGDAAAMIPTQILNQVIQNLKNVGNIFARITQTQYQGGISIPVADLNPTFTWMGSDEEPSEFEKAVADKSLVFNYHLLQGRIAVGLMAATVSLAIFEQTITQALTTGAIGALEAAIVNGTGSGQPKGVTTYTVDADHIVEMTDAELTTIKAWGKVEAAIDDAYDGESTIILMNKKTFNALQAAEDKNGRNLDIATVVNGKKYVYGREVETTDQIKSFAKATTGDIIACTVDLSKFMLNSNMNMFYKKYYDEDREQWKHKILMIADGKLAAYQDAEKLIGGGHVVYIKKKA